MSNEIVTVTKQFKADLNISADVSSNINIVEAPAGESFITVRVIGPQARVDSIEVIERAGCIFIREEASQGMGVNTSSGDVNVNYGNAAHVGSVRGGTVVVQNQGSVMRIVGSVVGSISVGAGGRVRVNGVDVTDVAGVSSPPARIKVLVPAGHMPVLGLELQGECVAAVQVLCGRTEIRAKGAAFASIRAADGCKIRGSGSTQVRVEELVGDCKVRVSGEARVDVLSGVLGELDVDASGTAQVRVQAASADRAELEASGCAGISVTRAKHVRRNVSGVASIVVGRVG